MRLAKAIQIATAALLLAGSVGCFHVSYSTGKGYSAQVQEGTSSFFLGGLIGTENLDVAELCPNNGMASLHTYHSFGDMFLTGLTMYLWAPRSYEMVCASGESAAVEEEASSDESAAAETTTEETIAN